MKMTNIIQKTIENENFRKVLYTGLHAQLVLMCVQDEIGMEVHATTDQILWIVEGNGEAILNDEVKAIKKDDVIFVPAGTHHNFVNTGKKPLKLYTMYAPPAHPDGIVEKTKKDAVEREG